MLIAIAVMVLAAVAVALVAWRTRAAWKLENPDRRPIEMEAHMEEWADVVADRPGSLVGVMADGSTVEALQDFERSGRVVDGPYPHMTAPGHYCYVLQCVPSAYDALTVDARSGKAKVTWRIRCASRESAVRSLPIRRTGAVAAAPVRTA